MTKPLLIVVATLLLSACGGGAQSVSAIARYDLGPADVTEKSTSAMPLQGIDAFAASWLDTTAMQYRLRYASNQQRQRYAQSRWVAPPVELLAQAMRRQLMDSTAVGPCRLRIDLDEFVQIFDSPQSSQVRLDVRVGLMSSNPRQTLAQRRFSVTQPAASADAQGGTAAMADAVRTLNADIHQWLGGLRAMAPSASGPSCAVSG